MNTAMKREIVDFSIKVENGVVKEKITVSSDGVIDIQFRFKNEARGECDA